MHKYFLLGLQDHELGVHGHEPVDPVGNVGDDVTKTVGGVPPVGAHLGAVVVAALLKRSKKEQFGHTGISVILLLILRLPL